MKVIKNHLKCLESQLTLVSYYKVTINATINEPNNKPSFYLIEKKKLILFCDIKVQYFYLNLY